MSFGFVHCWAVTPAPIESLEHSITGSSGPKVVTSFYPKHIHKKQNSDFMKRFHLVHPVNVLRFTKTFLFFILQDSSKTFCGLSRTSLCLRSYITRVTLSRPWDNPRLWLWLDGPLGGHDVDFLALIMMPAARTKLLMPLLSSARQIFTGVGLINTPTGWSRKTKTVG